MRCGGPALCSECAADAYRARAALAQPSPKCATCNDSGQIVVSGPHYQGEFQPPEYETEPCDMCAQPSPAQAEQAEAERPEVVARVDGTDEDWFIQPEDETELHNEGLLFAGCELGRMIDFDRIVGELRADRDSWAEQAEQRLADWDEMRKERDAALARVEQQERTIAGMNEAHAKLAGLYEAAQAQHSVPEGWKLVPIEPLLNMMSDKDHDTRITAERQLLSILADAPGNLVPQAWLDVQAERRRQITAEGWTPEHDDEHDSGELAAAGAAYALHAADHLNPYSQGDGGDEAPSCWPWHDGIAGRGEGPEKTEPAWWKPSTPRRDLVKACALALAEIERLDRACISQSPQPGAATASS